LFKRLPISFLILSNLVPVLGVFFADWNAASIVLVYWAENLVIGAYNILKMLTVAPLELKAMGGRLLVVLFFMIHYGGFAAGHGMFLLEIFDIGQSDEIMSAENDWPGPLVLLQMLYNVIHEVWTNMPAGFIWALTALLISHGISYAYNFIIAGERTRTSARSLMGQPYSRVLIMHIAIIAGGFFVNKLGSPVALLIALVAVKTVMDVMLHNKSHKKMLAADNQNKRKRKSKVGAN
jgi:hypothetical protein